MLDTILLQITFTTNINQWIKVPVTKRFFFLFVTLTAHWNPVLFYIFHFYYFSEDLSFTEQLFINILKKNRCRCYCVTLLFIDCAVVSHQNTWLQLYIFGHFYKLATSMKKEEEKKASCWSSSTTVAVLFVSCSCQALRPKHTGCVLPSQSFSH